MGLARKSTFDDSTFDDLASVVIGLAAPAHIFEFELAKGEGALKLVVVDVLGSVELGRLVLATLEVAGSLVRVVDGFVDDCGITAGAGILEVLAVEI